MRPRHRLALKGTGQTDIPAVLVVGSGAARSVAVRLDESAAVRFATADEEIAQRARSNGLDTHQLDVTDAKSLQPVTEGVDVAVVAERSDRRTLLIAQLLQACCGIDRVVAVVADEAYSEAFADVDIELVNLDGIITGAFDEHVSRLVHPG